MKPKSNKLKVRQSKRSAIKSGIYGIDATKSAVKVVHGSELTGIVK